MFKEYFKIAIKNLRTRPLRSWLTIVGVIIGVFLVVSLLSLSEGLKTAAMQQLRMMGKDLIMVFPGEINDMVTAFAGGLKLTDSDISAIKESKGVDKAVPFNWKAETVRYQGKTKTVLINGVTWQDGLDILKTDMGWSLKEGRWPVMGKKEIVVGSLVPEDVFPRMRVGTEAFIRGKKFNVAGILKSLGNKQDDSMIHMDLEIFKEITGERKGAKFVFVKVKEGFSTEKAITEIKESLEKSRKRKRNQDLPSFTVLSSEKVSGIVGNIMGLIQAIVFGFASIAIIVGGIGIMNTMYTSVRERTKEIGIMKAIGAKRSTIITIFLIESGLFGLVGGIGGSLLGFGLAKIVEIYFQVHPVLYFKAEITPGLILFALGFSFLVGCISGFLPARSASKLNPVDALRYE